MQFLIGLLLACLVLLNCALPVNAASSVSELPLEAQILKVIQQHPEAILESIQAYQQQQYEEHRNHQQAVVQKLTEDIQVLIGSSPQQGSSEKVLLVEFSDFQCPFCKEAHQAVQQFVKQHHSEITFVYKHLPLTDVHAEAMPAALAAWAAGQQGSFWPYHDALFDQQDQLGEALYVALANRFDLDIEQFNSDRTGELAKQAIQEDIDMARVLGIQGTPFFMMNKELFSGALPLSEIESILNHVNAIAEK